MNPVCPYCRTEIVAEGNSRLDCPRCGTPHHSECFAENGGCTVFGCSKAPADEGKISVTGSDLQPAPAPVPRPPAILAGSFSIFGGANLAAPSAAPSPQAQPARPTPPPPPVAGTGAPPPPRPGASQPATAFAPVPSLLPPRLPSDARVKSRVAFVLLGVFLGIFGMHNFYAGYNKRGAIQLALTILTFFYAAVITWIWAIIEVCVVNRDSEGTQFA